MSLRSLLRNAALGISLTVGCGSSENKIDRAFDQAQERLEQQGIEVRGGLWNRERDYTLLFREMRRDLGDLEAAVARRNGSGSCDEVGLADYDGSVYYCGPAAVQGNCDRSSPGDCLNQVCYEHDREYDDLLAQQTPLCLWSEQTRSADEHFFQGFDRCVEDGNCGFYCRIVGVIALNLSTIEYAFDSLGSGCLWDGEYETPQKKEKPRKKKEPKDDNKPKKVPKDESLRELCREYYELGLRDCFKDSNPPDAKELEGIIQGICYRPSVSSLEPSRHRYECAYESNCDDFLDCLNSR